MLSFLLGLLPGAVQISGKIADLLIARQQAKSDVEKAQIDAQIQQLNMQKEVILAETNKSFTFNGVLRGLAAIGPIAYLLKIFLWDKTIGAFYGCSGLRGDVNPDCHIFNTDRLSDPNLNWVMVAVIGFYFLTTIRR